ncbi:hypothetical protein DPMN_194784 [Dreissena polymorpha]|uniref:Uncharacterized protein n=1 Tax=Dreissena polymorpha TaxID=45954 RepID=A0A9D3Y5N4_DREPO|nr:hypothetical protein DPMN_194784 [Dreissena polymorpha]
MSGMSPAAREILLNQALKQINDNAIQSQGSFLNVLSSCRSDMKTIYSDLMSDIHVENTLPVEGVSNVEETPEDTLVIEPAVIIEKSNTESEADDYEEKTYLTRRGHKIDTDPNREIIAHIKKAAKSHVISKWSPGHKRHKRPTKEKNGSDSSVENNSQVEQELRLLRQKLHIMKTSQTSMVFKDEAKGLNPTEYVLVENECDLNTKSKAGVKTTQKYINHKKESQSKEGDDKPGMKTVKQYAHVNRTKVKNSLSSATVNENSDKNSKEEYKTVKISKRDVIHRDKPRKTNKNHGERRQENGNTQNLDGKFQVQHKGHVISKSKTRKSFHHENKSEVANKDGAIASDSDNNDMVNSIQTGRQSVDSGIILGNIFEDKISTAQPKTNRRRFSKTGHSSSDLASKENPSRLSDNSSISELKSKSRQVNLGIDVASKIVDSRKNFYQNGAVHSVRARLT